MTDYLGLTAAQLRTQLEAGKTLADIAKAQGKTVAGLEDAIVAAATKKLDAAVAAGKLTAAQEATMLADLKSHVDDMVNRTGPPAGGHGGPGGRGHFGAAAGCRQQQLQRHHHQPDDRSLATPERTAEARDPTLGRAPTRRGRTSHESAPAAHVANRTDLPASAASATFARRGVLDAREPPGVDADNVRPL